jgi:hypothetical protein
VILLRYFVGIRLICKFLRKRNRNYRDAEQNAVSMELYLDESFPELVANE